MKVANVSFEDTIPDTTKHIALDKAVEYHMSRDNNMLDDAPDKILAMAAKFEVWLRLPNQIFIVPVGPMPQEISSAGLNPND